MRATKGACRPDTSDAGVPDVDLWAAVRGVARHPLHELEPGGEVRRRRGDVAGLRLGVDVYVCAAAVRDQVCDLEAQRDGEAPAAMLGRDAQRFDLAYARCP